MLNKSSENPILGGLEMIFITGGSGFIGAAFIEYWLNTESEEILNIDNLTYASHFENTKSFEKKSQYHFIKADICDQKLMDELFKKYQPTAIFHFAAESHVDRSIENPLAFINTNIVGTYNLLASALKHFQSLTSSEKKSQFRFIHVSTDEVFGSLRSDDPAFVETTPYQPNSPYSASKASSDHFVRAFFHTYHLPVLTTNCSNNFGPRQNKEKFIPTIIQKILKNERIPIYGNGENIRDWLYVFDHCEAIHRVWKKGRIGETYNIGGNNEIKNLEIAHMICEILDEVKKSNSLTTYKELIQFVEDRPGHDFRYAINSEKIFNELGWKPNVEFKMGLRKTIEWYLDHENYLIEQGVR